MKKVSLLLTILFLGFILVGCGKDNNFGGEINVYTRDAASGTREAFQTVIGFESTELTNKAIESLGNGDQATKVGNDKYGIGYVSLSTDMKSNNLKVLKFNDVEATIANVLNNSYKLQRPFNYVTRGEGDFLNDDVKNMTAAFIAYLGTKDGMAVLSANSVVVDDLAAPTWNSIKALYPVINTTSTVTVRMGGSTSVDKAIKASADSFKALVSGFDFTMNQTGSSDGYKRTLGSNKDNNPVEIGFASRSFKADSENVTTAYKSGTFGIDAVCVVVEKDNPLNSISTEEVLKIYTGETVKWEDLTK